MLKSWDNIGHSQKVWIVQQTDDRIKAFSVQPVGVEGW